MNAVRIKTRLESVTLHAVELAPLVGKEVEIIVLEEQPSVRAVAQRPGTDSNYPLRGSIISDDDPFGPAVAEEDWDALH